MNIAYGLPDLKRISCNGNFLFDFVKNFPGESHVREVRSDKYLLANQRMAEFWGLRSVNDMIGMKSFDLCVADVLNRREKMDRAASAYEKFCEEVSGRMYKQVLSEKHAVSCDGVSLDNEGMVVLDRIIRFPIEDSKKTVIAILSTFVRRTHQLSLDTLFEFYKNIYPKNKAIHQLLKHLKLDTHFSLSDLPTCREIQTLFAMREDCRCKAVARKLDISIATASNYMSNIQEKLTSSSLHTMLIKLRSYPYGKS